MQSVVPYKDVYKAQLRDLKTGVLNADLTLRVPFEFRDLRFIENGEQADDGFVVVGRRGSRGGYAILDENGAAATPYIFTYSPRLRVFKNYIIDSPRPNRYVIYYRDGTRCSPLAFTEVWTHPVLTSKGYDILSVRRKVTDQLALFNVADGRTVSAYRYDRISRVAPVMPPRDYIPLLEAYEGYDITLLRPNGDVLTNLTFVGVEDYNNWKQLRAYFGLADDPEAQAIAWTENMDIYIVYTDDRVVFMGRFEG